MWRMLQADSADDYVIGTGVHHSVRSASTTPSSTWASIPTTSCAIDPALLRPAEVDTLLADPTKAREQLGWTRADRTSASWSASWSRPTSSAARPRAARAAAGGARGEPRRARAGHRRGGLHRLDAGASACSPTAAAWSGSTPSTRSTRRRRSAATCAPRSDHARLPADRGRRARRRRRAPRLRGRTVRRAGAPGRAGGRAPEPRAPRRVRRRERARYLACCSRRRCRQRHAARGLRVVVVGLRRARRRGALPRERRRRAPVSPYAATKRAGELLAHAFHAALRPVASSARASSPPTVRASAPTSRSGASPSACGAATPVQVFGDGSALRDFTYVDDLVEGLCARSTRTSASRCSTSARAARSPCSQVLETLERVLGREGADRVAAGADGRRVAHLGRHRRGARARSATSRASPSRRACAASPTWLRGGRVSARERSALVTGGAGFIGGAPGRERLCADGWRVRVLDDLSTGREAEPRRGRATGRAACAATSATPDALARALRGVEVVFHQAAVAVGAAQRGRAAPHEQRQRGRHARACSRRRATRGVRRVVYAASSSAYGDAPELPKVESMPAEPLSPYALQKYVRRGLLPPLHRALRPRDRGAALLQRLRPAPGPEERVRGRDPEVHHRVPARRVADDLRRRRADARLRHGARRRRAPTCWRRRPARLGRGLQHRRGRAHQPERAVRRDPRRDGREGAGSRYAPPREGDVRDSVASLGARPRAARLRAARRAARGAAHHHRELREASHEHLRDRHRLRGPRHRRLLRRVRLPGDLCRRRRGEDRRAASRGRCRSTSPASRTWSCATSTQGRLSFTTDTAEAVRASLVVFIAVPTPPREDGSTDLAAVEAVAREIGRAMDGYKVIVNKSTVPVGTAEKVRALDRGGAAARRARSTASAWPRTRSSCARAPRSATSCAPTAS